MTHNPTLAKVYDLALLPSERLAGGCRLNQDTLAILDAAGFRVERLWRSTKGGVVSGEARRR